MNENLLIKKIKRLSLVSFILPLITINVCFLMYYWIGNVQSYKKVNWNNTSDTFEINKYKSAPNNILQCPKYEINQRIYEQNNGNKLDAPFDGVDLNYTKYFVNAKNQNEKIKSVFFQYGKKINSKCIKNYTIFNWLISTFDLENSLIKIRSGKSGFSPIKNPYIYGEVSISRTARYYPAYLIFKPLIILSAFFLFFYWLNNLRFLNHLRNKNTIKTFSNKFFYFGSLSCFFLIIHSIFLGVELDFKLYQSFRRLVMVLFVLFEVMGQISLTINLYKLKSSISEYLNLTVLNTKVLFVVLILLGTLISIYILAFKDPSTNFKNVLEWNYFSALLVYYFLTRLTWKLTRTN